MERLIIRSMCAATVALLVSFSPWRLARAQAPQGKPVTIRGKISALEGQSLKVATSSGRPDPADRRLAIVDLRGLLGLAG
jgi:hypothetical protein